MAKEGQYSQKQLQNALFLRESYLNTALILCRYISIKSLPKRIDSQKELEQQENHYYGGEYHESIEYMIYPLLFTVKHGIELFLKLILYILEEKIQKTHNLNSLFYKVKESLGKVNIGAEIIDEIETIINELGKKDEENMKYRYPIENNGFFTNISKIDSSSTDEYKFIGIPRYNGNNIEILSQTYKENIEKLIELFNKVLEEDCVSKKVSNFL